MNPSGNSRSRKNPRSRDYNQVSERANRYWEEDRANRSPTLSEGIFRHMATGHAALDSAGIEAGKPVSGTKEVSNAARKPVINDFSLQVATVNGSGSQSANSVLLRSIFGMGVPVSGKNLFPSNIAGLPTWYIIRANKDGYVARTRDYEFLVALNPETAKSDMMALPAGGVAIYEENANLKQYRDDIA